VRKVERHVKKEKPLQVIIDDLRWQHDYEENVAERLALSGERLTEHNKAQACRLEEITRLEVELEMNPKAIRIVTDVELVETTEIDMVKLAQDKERGRIKSISWTEFGPKVELYAADGALNTLAKIQGLFEKDNMQKSAQINVGFTNTDDD